MPRYLGPCQALLVMPSSIYTETSSLFSSSFYFSTLAYKFENMSQFTPINRSNTPSVTLRGPTTSVTLRPRKRTNTLSATLIPRIRKRTPPVKPYRNPLYFKRLYLLPEPGKRQRGRPKKMKTEKTLGRPRKFPSDARDCKRKDGVFDTFFHPDFPHVEISLNALPPLFVLFESLDPTPNCKLHITFYFYLLLFILTPI